VILVINKGLWLGGQMEHSLINPYQIRVNEGQLSDDPTNQDRLFGITIEGVEIPFKMKGSTCMFHTRTPTSWELENCRHIELTSDLEWDPSDIHFGDENEHPTDDGLTTVQAYQTRHHKSDIDPATLSRMWGIGLETAWNTIRVTTQQGIRHAIHPITRQYRTDYMALWH